MNTLWIDFRQIIFCFILTISSPAICSAVIINYSEPLYLGQSKDVQATQQQIEQWSQQTGNKVVIKQLPGMSNDLLSLYQQLFLSKSKQIDIFRIDIIWPGMLKKHLIDLNPFTSKLQTSLHFPSILKNNTDEKGRLLAMPFFADVGLLFFRKDLLDKYGFSAPETWTELKQTALYIVQREKNKNPKLIGFAFQGKNHEGLTCNALEWIDSFHGGTIVNASGKITVNNPNAVKALETAASWIGTISPRSVLSHNHENTQKQFQSGNAVFARNWPYAWSLANRPNSPVRGKIAVAPLPKGGKDGKHSGTLGGWGLGVSKNSKNPAEAAQLVMYMTNKKLQRYRALYSGLNPTMPELYLDSKLKQVHPYIDTVKVAFEAGVARPSTVTGNKYNKVSKKFSTAVYKVISGTVSASVALNLLESELQKIKGRSEW